MSVEVGPDVVAEMRRRTCEDQPCDEQGFQRDGATGYKRKAITPRGYVIRGDRLFIKCTVCPAPEKEAPLQALVDAGRGDQALARFSWRCECGSTEVKLRAEWAS